MEENIQYILWLNENANWKHRTCNSRSTADHWGQGDWHHVTWGLTRWQGGGWRTPTQNLYQLIFLCSLCTGNFSIKSLNSERFLLWLFEAFLASLEKRIFYGGLKFMLSESSDENCKPLGFSLFASPLEISDNGSRWQRRCFWGARKRLCNFEQTASIPVFLSNNFQVGSFNNTPDDETTGCMSPTFSTSKMLISQFPI